MAEKKKNTRAFTKNHPEIPLLSELPPGVKRNQNKKRSDSSTWVPRSNLSPQSFSHPIEDREFSSNSTESEAVALLGKTFSAPSKKFQDKGMSPMVNFPYRSNIANEVDHSWGYRENMERGFSPGQEPYVANLMDFDPIESEAATTDHEELIPQLVLLKKQVEDEEAKHLLLEKEKEKIIMNSIIERDSLLRRMASLQEKNKNWRRNPLVYILISLEI